MWRFESLMLLIANLINPQQHMVDQMSTFFFLWWFLGGKGRGKKNTPHTGPIKKRNAEGKLKRCETQQFMKLKATKGALIFTVTSSFLLSVFCASRRYTPRKILAAPRIYIEKKGIYKNSDSLSIFKASLNFRKKGDIQFCQPQ